MSEAQKKLKILVSGATKTVSKYAGHPSLGALLTPQTGNKAPVGIPWAADNAAFSNWDEKKFESMLGRVSKCKDNPPMWVACPDVVCDAQATMELFNKWEPVIHELGLKVALVLQNGQEDVGIPWERVDALFIGGDNGFKYCRAVRRWTAEARKRGMEVHMGRVNSLKRLDYAREIGCTSVDGTGFSRFPDTYIPRFLRHLEVEQMTLFDGYAVA